MFDELHDNSRIIISNLGKFNNCAKIIGAFSLLIVCLVNEIDCIMNTIVNITTINRREWLSMQLITNIHPKNHTINDIGLM